MEEEIREIENNMNIQYGNMVSSMRFKVGTYFGKECVVALSGVGKVFASICTQTMITKYNPGCIINIGTAGGIGTGVNIFDLVVANNVIQHDYDISAFGNRKRGQISGLNIREIPCSERIMKVAKEIAEKAGINVHIGNVLTGDQFINEPQKIKDLRTEFDGLACEMECGAIGQVCYINNVEFAALKTISDKADKSSAVDFSDFIAKYPQIINDLIGKTISKM